MALPRSSARCWPPRSRWPACGRAVVDARLERMDRAAQRVDRQRRGDVGRAREPLGARAAPAPATAVDGCVPLISASPSFGAERDRASGRRARSASAPLDARAGVVADRSPRPRRSAPAPDARAARDRRSRRPSRGSAPRGCTRAFSSAISSSSVSTRMPEKPFASTLARSAIVARTARTGSGSPTPAAWLRSRLSCSAPSASGANLDARRTSRSRC